MNYSKMDNENRGKQIMLRAILITACACLLASCSSTVVREGATPVHASKPGATVVVKRGDNLYRIATRNGISTLDLATWNNISPPYTIYPGQRLRLYSGDGRRTASSTSRPPTGSSSRPATGTRPASTASSTRPAAAASPFAWRWPTEGQLVGTYAAGNPTRQGIDIAGKPGQPVQAVADGVVVYSGSGLVGYGELVIVKHNDEWLSAYGHNRARLVNEGQVVKAGQQIAEMGHSGASRDMLHFEIRHNGKPVDPLAYLPRR